MVTGLVESDLNNSIAKRLFLRMFRSARMCSRSFRRYRDRDRDCDPCNVYRTMKVAYTKDFLQRAARTRSKAKTGYLSEVIETRLQPWPAAAPSAPLPPPEIFSQGNVVRLRPWPDYAGLMPWLCFV